MAPKSWAVVVRLLDHIDLLEEMPAPTDISASNVVELLAAAAGVAAPASNAGRRCLEAALLGSGAVHVFVDGVDEVMPAYRDKALRLLGVLLQETKATRVWVASRPEVADSLRRLLRCSPWSLRPLSGAGQRAYLRSKFTSLGAEGAPEHIDRLAKMVVDAFAPVPNTEESPASSINDQLDAEPLLGVPLFLRMAGEAFADEAKSALQSQKGHVSQLKLFRRFMEHCREIFGIKAPVAKIIDFPGPEEASFLSVHQNFAMLIWTSASLPQYQKKFRASVKELEKHLTREKTGILWLTEDGRVQFVHYMLVEYLVATWLFDRLANPKEIQPYLLIALRERNRCRVVFFLDLMLAEGRPLHKAIVENDGVALDAPFPREQQDDLGGRSALHLAAAYGRAHAVRKLLEAGHCVTQLDSLLQWSALQYADATLELTAIEELLNRGADSSQLKNIVDESQRNVNLIVQAAVLDLVKVMQILIIKAISREKMIVSSLLLGNIDSTFVATSNREPKDGDEACDMEKLLITAAGAGSRGVAALLLDNGTNVDCTFKELTPLNEAIKHGHENIVQLLLSRGADISKSLSIFYAASYGRVDIMKMFMKKITPSLITQEFNTVYKNQWTPLHCASQMGHQDVVELLLDIGAAINGKTSDGDMPLHIAALNGREEAVELLLARGADVHSLGWKNYTPLHRASQKGHLNVVQLLLARGADVLRRGANGRTSIHEATFSGPLEVVKHLMERLDANVIVKEINDHDELLWTPLHYASKEGFKDIVEFLLDKGASIDAKNVHGVMPIHIASLHGRVEVVELLLRRGADVHSFGHFNCTPLHYACQGGHLNVVQLLLTLGADFLRRGENGRTAMHEAALNGQLEVLKHLVENLDADLIIGEINSCIEEQWTPLHLASQEGHKDVVEFLLDKGASINSQDSDGDMAIHIAALEGHVEVVEQLLRHGASVHSFGELNYTPLHCASLKGHLKLVQLLLSHGADILRRAENGRTSIHNAAFSCHVEVLKHLVENLDGNLPANVFDSPEEDLWAPLHFASQEGHTDVVDFLLEKGASINAQGVDGCMPIHIAASNGRVEVLEHLLRCGADVHSLGRKNYTPLHEASRKGHLNVVQVLLSRGADPLRKGTNGRTFVHEAALNGHLEVLKHVLERLDASVVVQEINSHDEEQWIPVYLASWKGHKAVVEYLLDKGASINGENANGFMPIHVASSHGNVEVVELLLRRGAGIHSLGYNNNTPLHYASQSGHLNVVQMLLSRGADTLRRGREGWSSIHGAALNGHLEVLKHLVKRLDSNILLHEINVPTKYQCTSLHYASQKGHKDVVEFLLDNGASINVQEVDGYMPIHDAALNGHVRVLELLLQRGADVHSLCWKNYTPLHYASQEGHLAVMQLLLSHGTDLLRQGANGRTALHEAAFNGHLAVLKYLVEKLDANVLVKEINVPGEDQWTPLHYASHEGHKDVVEFLLEKGASINVVDVGGDMPIHVAALNGRVEVVEQLLSRSADVNSLGEYNYTPLHEASRNGHVHVVQLLLSHGADVLRRGANGRTSMHEAAFSGHLEVLKLLVQKLDAKNIVKEINSPDKNQFTPLYMASQEGHKDIVEFLLGEGASINAKDVNGDMPIHIAAKNGRLELVELLLRRGADVHSLGCGNYTPLHRASKEGHLDVVQLLLSRGAVVLRRGTNGQTSIHQVIFNGNLEVLKLLVEKLDAATIVKEINAPIEHMCTTLHVASWKGHKQIVEFLLDNGASINAKTEWGISSIHLAQLKGRVEVVELLLRRGADVHSLGWKNYKPLHEASRTSLLSVVQRFSSRTAEVLRRGGNRRTSISNAALNGQLEKLKQMIENLDANDIVKEINATDEHQCTPLHLASERGQKDVVEFLLNNGANINAKNVNGLMPIHIAQLNGHLEVAMLLLGRGAELLSFG